METLAKAKREKGEANKTHNKNSSKATKSSMSRAKVFCIVAFLVISLSAFISIAMSLATHMLIVHAIHPQDFNKQDQPSFNGQATFNCSAEIASTCSLKNSNSNIYNCTTEAVLIKDELLTTMAMQCIQIDDFELSMPIVTSLIVRESSNEARCYCSVLIGGNIIINSTLLCGIWVSKCSPNT